MGNNFKVELEELEQARNTLQNLLDDVFNSVQSPVHPVTLQNNTASSVGQGQYGAGVHHALYADPSARASSNFGPMDQGIEAISALDTAHGAAHQAILQLVNDLNNQINMLSDRATKTHQVYSNTEDELHIGVNNIQSNV